MLCLYADSQRSTVLVPLLQKLKIVDLVAFVGVYSYSIYLWHLMIPLHLQGFLHLFLPAPGQFTFFWSYVLISLAVGIVFSKLIEYPVLRIRDRLFPSSVRLRSDTGLAAKVQSVPGDLRFTPIAEQLPRK